MPMLRKLRKALGLSIAGVTLRTGIHSSTICQIERFKLAGSANVKATLAEFYGKPQKALFDEVGMAK